MNSFNVKNIELIIDTLNIMLIININNINISIGFRTLKYSFGGILEINININVNKNKIIINNILFIIKVNMENNIKDINLYVGFIS
jgi:hypothetical protein